MVAPTTNTTLSNCVFMHNEMRGYGIFFSQLS